MNAKTNFDYSEYEKTLDFFKGAAIELILDGRGAQDASGSPESSGGTQGAPEGQFALDGVFDGSECDSARAHFKNVPLFGLRIPVEAQEKVKAQGKALEMLDILPKYHLIMTHPNKTNDVFFKVTHAQWGTIHKWSKEDFKRRAPEGMRLLRSSVLLPGSFDPMEDACIKVKIVVPPKDIEPVEVIQPLVKLKQVLDGTASESKPASKKAKSASKKAPKKTKQTQPQQPQQTPDDGVAPEAASQMLGVLFDLQVKYPIAEEILDKDTGLPEPDQGLLEPDQGLLKRLLGGGDLAGICAKSGLPNATIGITVLEAIKKVRQLETYHIVSNNGLDDAALGKVLQHLHIQIRRDALGSGFVWRGGRGQWAPLGSVMRASILNATPRLITCPTNPNGTPRPLKVTERDLSRSLNTLTDGLSVNPLAEWLRGAPEWDKEDRLTSLITDSLGVVDSVDYRELGRLLIHAIVARQLFKRVTFNCVPVLMGERQIGKSTWIREILGGRWHSTSVRLNINPDEFVRNIQGYATAEVSELSKAKKSDVEQIKSLVAAEVDSSRKLYHQEMTDFPRRCTLIGTLNPDNQAKGSLPPDDCGNYRHWAPIDCDEVRKGVPASRADMIVEYWKKNRDQVFAQAMAELKEHPQTILHMSEEADACREKRASARSYQKDVHYVEPVQEAISRDPPLDIHKGFALSEVRERVVQDYPELAHLNRVASVLVVAGYKRKPRTAKGYRWVLKEK